MLLGLRHFIVAPVRYKSFKQAICVYICVCLSVYSSCLFIFLSVYRSNFIFIPSFSICIIYIIHTYCLSGFLSFCLSVFLSFSLFACLSFKLYIYTRFVNLFSLFLSFCLQPILSILLPMKLSVYLSPYLNTTYTSK